MFKTFRRLVEGLDRLNATLGALARAQAEQGPATDRLEVLELSRSQWEAEMEGIFLKADGKAKAAASSEARERTMRKSYEHLIDPLDDDRQEESTPLPLGYAPASETEGMPAVRLDVAPDNKTRALNSKWGIA